MINEFLNRNKLVEINVVCCVCSRLVYNFMRFPLMKGLCYMATFHIGSTPCTYIFRFKAFTCEIKFCSLSLVLHLKENFWHAADVPSYNYVDKLDRLIDSS